MLRIGGVYNHPEYGPIRIDSGDYLVDGRISNWYKWTVLSDDTVQSGYGTRWPDISDQYVTITIPKFWLDTGDESE